MLDAKGRCCGRKPMHYKGGAWNSPRRPMLFCCRCDREYDPETHEQRSNFAWEKNEAGEWQGKRPTPPPRPQPAPPPKPPTVQELIASAIANARGNRRGVPTITNVLDLLPRSLRDEVMDDAASVLAALKGAEYGPL